LKKGHLGNHFGEKIGLGRRRADELVLPPVSVKFEATTGGMV